LEDPGEIVQRAPPTDRVGRRLEFARRHVIELVDDGPVTIVL
jgi:hypothetical protein